MIMAEMGLEPVTTGVCDGRNGVRGLVCTAAILSRSCPLMGWFGRAPAPPVTNLARGSNDKGARHVPEPQNRSGHDRH